MTDGVELALPVFLATHLLLAEVILALALVMALSGLDDLFIDLVFMTRLAGRRRHAPTLESLRQVPPEPLAIIVPAWDEAAVIGAMLRRLLRDLDYPAFHVFVGLYPNDPAGFAVVTAIRDVRLTAVVCSRPGPTSKADCLNHLWRAVLAHETRCGMRFKAIVLHDAEDVVHPQALHVHNGLIPALAMVQLPVTPLPDSASRWVAGHYLDEFATGHVKDVPVRAALGAAVPSAGVGCAIDRTLLGRIAASAGGDPFDPICLTEDYELGLKLSALGGRTALVRVRCPDGSGVIATAEHFPASFDAARRQKTRWLLGIALAGWDRIGWPGGAADRYMLVRDRKTVAASLLTIIAYGVVLLAALDLALGMTVFARAAVPPLFGPTATLLVNFNLALLGWRLAMRAACTAHVHGWREGMRAIPRTLVSNVINATAAWVACRRYAAMLRTGTPLAWDKTIHRFPSPTA